jgi:hypothetical protein
MQEGDAQHSLSCAIARGQRTLRRPSGHASHVFALCLQITAAATAALAPRIAQLMDSRLAAATATINVYFHLIKKDDGAVCTLELLRCSGTPRSFGPNACNQY